LALVFGGLWRLALGHDWSTPLWKIPAAPDWFRQRARSSIMVLGAAGAALIMWFSGGLLLAIGAAAILTPVYFAIGNGRVLRGPSDPAWPYARALILKYFAPAILANLVLLFLGYPTAIFAAGMIAALGYFGFWRPDPHGTDPWNEKAEALSGAAWFGFLAFPVTKLVGVLL
jgi:hypothetical protein